RATATANGAADVMLGDGQGGFAAIGPANGAASGDGAVSLSVADFNHDGNPDLAMVAPGPGGSEAATVLLGNGDGAFRAPTYWAGPALALAVGDFNGDGNSDLVVSEEDYTPSFGYFEGPLRDAQGGFNGGWGTQPSYLMWTGLAVPDLDLNGTLDLITLNGPSDFALSGNGDGSFRGYETLVSATGDVAAVGDFTGDGIPDLVSAGYGVSVSPGHGDGTFDVGNGFDANGTYQTSVAVAGFNAYGPLAPVSSDLKPRT